MTVPWHWKLNTWELNADGVVPIYQLVDIMHTIMRQEKGGRMGFDTLLAVRVFATGKGT